jgi:hypothetical protein
MFNDIILKPGIQAPGSLDKNKGSKGFLNLINPGRNTPFFQLGNFLRFSSRKSTNDVGYLGIEILFHPFGGAKRRLLRRSEKRRSG